MNGSMLTALSWGTRLLTLPCAFGMACALAAFPNGTLLAPAGGGCLALGDQGSYWTIAGECAALERRSFCIEPACGGGGIAFQTRPDRAVAVEAAEPPCVPFEDPAWETKRVLTGAPLCPPLRSFILARRSILRACYSTRRGS